MTPESSVTTAYSSHQTDPSNHNLSEAEKQQLTEKVNRAIELFNKEVEAKSKTPPGEWSREEQAELDALLADIGPAIQEMSAEAGTSDNATSSQPQPGSSIDPRTERRGAVYYSR